MKLATCFTCGLLTTMLSSACYTYMPAQVETIPAGDHVRVVVTRQGRLALPESFEPEGPFITGKFVRVEADRFFLSIPVAQQQQGFFVSQIAQEISLRTGEVVQMELRKLDRAKTGLFVVGTAAAAAAVVYGIIEAGRRPEGGNPPGPEEFRFRLFSIPVR